MVKLLPVALVLGLMLGGVAVIVAVVGVSLATGLVGVGLLLAVLLSPIWLPVLALFGIVALVKKANAKPVMA